MENDFVRALKAASLLDKQDDRAVGPITNVDPGMVATLAATDGNLARLATLVSEYARAHKLTTNDLAMIGRCVVVEIMKADPTNHAGWKDLGGVQVRESVERPGAVMPPIAPPPPTVTTPHVAPPASAQGAQAHPPDAPQGVPGPRSQSRGAIRSR